MLSGQHQQATAPKPKASEAGALNFGRGERLDPEAVARGQKIYVPNCGFCHGADAAGKSGPDLIRSPLALRDESGNLLGPLLRNGRPDRGMPSFPNLTHEQIADISTFLHSRKQAAANRFAYIIKGLLTGDAKAGEAYFNGAGQCSTCHSVKGDLAGIASRFEPVDLQRQFLSPGPSMMDQFLGKKSKPLPETTVQLTLPSGQVIEGALVHRDEFNIELRDRAGWHRSYPLDGAKLKVDDPLRFHKEQLAKYTDSDMHNLLAYLETLK
jgi:cytochrome c oxidase cbb3-type subunit 3